MACVFCGIVEGNVPATKVYEDDQVVAFPDLNPQAPTHVLVIPKRHISSLMGLEAEQDLLAVHRAVRNLAESLGLWPDGFRLVINSGPQGGQTVHHLHFHLLGGRFMKWPPG